MLLGKLDESAGRVSSMASLVLRRSGIFFLLAFALLAQSAWGQRIGPLGPLARQQLKAQSSERAAPAVRPPSLQLSLPPPTVAALPPLGPDDFAAFTTARGPASRHRCPPSVAAGVGRTELLWGDRQDDRRGSVAIDPGRASLAPEDNLPQRSCDASSLPGLRHRSGQTVALLGGRAGLPPYAGSGLYADGNFWSDIVFGDSLTIEYLPDGESAEEAVPFQIVEISHIWDDAFGSNGEADVQPPIAASGRARTGREAVKPLTNWINVVVGRQSMEQSPAAGDPSDTKTAQLAKQIQSVERSASLDHPFQKAATPLSPGQPTTFSLRPVDSPTLFYGITHFGWRFPRAPPA